MGNASKGIPLTVLNASGGSFPMREQAVNRLMRRRALNRIARRQRVLAGMKRRGKR